MLPRMSTLSLVVGGLAIFPLLTIVALATASNFWGAYLSTIEIAYLILIYETFFSVGLIYLMTSKMKLSFFQILIWSLAFFTLFSIAQFMFWICYRHEM